MQQQKLTDDEILDMVFNPTSEFILPNNNMESSNTTKHHQINPELLQELKTLELQAIEYSEKSLYNKSLEILDTVLHKCPIYASAYNNRAQVYRLLGNDSAALGDLNAAIQYSEYDSSVRGNAYTQRAILKNKMGDLIGQEQDLQMGAKYGNAIALQQIKNNPYAKLCSSIVQQAIKDL